MKLTVFIIGIICVATEFLISSKAVYEDNTNYLNSDEAITNGYSYQTKDYNQGNYYSTKKSDYSSKFA